MMIKVKGFKICCVLYLLVIGLCGLPSLAQISTSPVQQVQPQEDEDTRGLWYDGFLKKRAGSVPRRPVRYRRVTPRLIPPPVAEQVKPESTENMIIGITIWRLRQSAAGNGQPVAPTAERVESNTLFSVGDKVFLTIEVPRAAYLYVFDREQYSNGQFGDPDLIFPTTRIRNGNGKVEAGLLVRIPDQRDEIPYFNLTSKTTELVGEDIAVLVTTQPLSGLQIGPRPLTLSKAQFAQWKKNWGSEAEQFELAGEQNKEFTKAEQEASADGERKLTQEDPLPQILYRVVTKPGNHVMINLPMRYAR